MIEHDKYDDEFNTKAKRILEKAEKAKPVTP